MATSNAVATRHGTALMDALPVGASHWGMMHEQATVLVKSGFLPDAIKTPEQAVAIILTGQELGIPAMLALRSISIIKGKPTLSADLMAALIHREIDRHRDGEFDVLPPTADACTVRVRRWGKKQVKALVYTMDDAKLAGLTGPGTNYAKHPKAMLKARAISSAARVEFQDVIAGLYAPEELETDQILDEPLVMPPLAETAARLVVTSIVDGQPSAIGFEDVEDGEPVNPDTSEISHEPLSLDDDIKRLSDLLGTTAQEVIAKAREEGWKRNPVGKQAIVKWLLEQVDAEEARRVAVDDSSGDIADANDAELPGMPETARAHREPEDY